MESSEGMRPILGWKGWETPVEWILAHLPSVIWFAAMVGFGVFEAVTVGLTSIWFALGALCALVVSTFTDNLLVQFIVFLVVSCVALLLLRPVMKKVMMPRQVATNADRAIGKEAVVTEEIDNLRASGTVKLAGVIWTARSEGDLSLPVGARVRVLRIEGVKLIVTPVTL